MIITYDFPPSLRVGAHACDQIARHLPLYGWEPIVLTVQERHIEFINFESQRPFPALVVRTRVIPHPLTVYRSVKSRLRMNVCGTGGGGGSLQKIGALRRGLLSMFMMPDRYTGWILPAVTAGLGVIRRRGVHHLFSSGPNWTNHVVGLVLSKLTGLPWSAHFRDPWTQVPQGKPVSALSWQLETILEKMVITQATFVACVTDEHTNVMRRMYPDLPSDKFVTIPNGFDETEWKELGLADRRIDLTRRDKFVITYCGNLYRRRNPLPLFRALRVLVDSGEVDLESFRVELVGNCDMAEGRRVTDIAAECGIDRCVTVTGRLRRAEALRKLANSDLLLLLAEEWPLRIPAKTYEYLRSGRPILALTSEEAVVKLLRRTGGAWVVHPQDHRRIAAALREAYGQWKDGGDGPVADQAVVASFDRQLLAGRFADLFEFAAGRAFHRD